MTPRRKIKKLEGRDFGDVIVYIISCLFVMGLAIVVLNHRSNNVTLPSAVHNENSLSEATVEVAAPIEDSIIIPVIFNESVEPISEPKKEVKRMNWFIETVTQLTNEAVAISSGGVQASVAHVSNVLRIVNDATLGKLYPLLQEALKIVQ